MFKKIICLVIIYFLIASGASSLLTIAQDMNGEFENYFSNENFLSYIPNIDFEDYLYVGGIGPGNYSKIQDAIDNSSDGDTIFVYDDSSPYYENIVIDKTINLIGENKNTTIIDGKNLSFVVIISADNVKISGFTIQNSKNVGIKLLSSFNTIFGNIIKNCGKDDGRAIYANPPAEYNTISENLLIDNDLGISIWGMTAVLTNYTITNNTILNCYTTGIVLGGTEDCVVSGNTIFNHNLVNDERCSGIYVTYLCIRNIISENTIVKPANVCKGIMIDESCYQNSIYENTITDHMWGMWLGRGFYDNQIYKNNVVNNTYGMYLTGGAWGDVRGNIFSENTITNNEYGLNLEPGFYNIKENTFTSNTIKDNTYGIYCLTYGVGPIGEIFNNVFIKNIIINNNYGFYSSKYFFDNVIYLNNFINNRKSNAYCKGSNFWDNEGEGNYWENYIGLLFPALFDMNQDGIGNIPYRRIKPLIYNLLSGNKDRYPLMNPFSE